MFGQARPTLRQCQNQNRNTATKELTKPFSGTISGLWSPRPCACRCLFEQRRCPLLGRLHISSGGRSPSMQSPWDREQGNTWSLCVLGNKSPVERSAANCQAHSCCVRELPCDSRHVVWNASIIRSCSGFASISGEGVSCWCDPAD